MIGSYPKVYAIGHRHIAQIFDGPVIVEEKIDGSQFSMCLSVTDGSTLHLRSKGQQIVLDAPDKLFTEAVSTAQRVQYLLSPGRTYRCEYLQKPKHNVLAYDRIPSHHLIIFDIEDVAGNPLGREDKEAECNRIGLECVPLLYEGEIDSFEHLQNLLDTTSVLGGQKIEGFVVKNYAHITQHDGKYLVGKYVSERFKEFHGVDWRKRNPTQNDILEQLITAYRTPARWEKAIQHLRDAGALDGDPRDIGALIKEVRKDVDEECADEIKQRLYKYFWPKVSRALTSGLPEYYKQQLAQKAFE